MINHHTVDEKVLNNLFSTLSRPDELKEQWQKYETEIQNNDASQEILSKIRDTEKRKENIVSAIGAGVLDFADAKAQIDSIKIELAELNNLLDEQKKTTQEPDWESLLIDKNDFKLMDFIDQRKAIENAITSITLYNTYAVITYPFPRTKSGSCDARINLARGERYKLKNQNRTRR